MREENFRRRLSLNPWIELQGQISLDGGRVVSFAVTLYWRREHGNVILARSDCNHGRPHRHSYFLLPEDPRRRRNLELKTLETLLHEEKVDLKQNWQRYLAAFIDNKIPIIPGVGEKCD